MAELFIAPELLCDIAAGSVGGFCSKALDYPFDTAKVLLQTQTKTAPKYTGTFDCLSKSVKEKGFRSLYDGVSSRLLGSMAENAVCFLSYSAIKKELLQHKTTLALQEAKQFDTFITSSEVQLSLAELSIAGAGSGLAVSHIMTPVELVKCRLQVSSQLAQPLYKGSLDCLLHTFRQEGLRGLYKGHLSTMYREVPGNFCWYLTYEVVCKAISESLGKEREELSVQAHMAGGAAAGVMYWAAIFPVDTVKSVLQTQTQMAGNGRTTFQAVCTNIYREQGLRGLYRGFGVTAMRSAPANAVLFAAYEQTSQFLKN